MSTHLNYPDTQWWLIVVFVRDTYSSYQCAYTYCSSYALERIYTLIAKPRLQLTDYYSLKKRQLLTLTFDTDVCDG